MKKFLSIFVAVAMVFSLFAGTFAPNAAAATGKITDTAKVADLDFWSTLPDPENTPPGDEGVLYTNTDEFVYKMGDTIHGTFVLEGSVHVGEPIWIELVKWGYGSTNDWDYGNPVDSTSFYQVAGKTSYTWQIGTGNVNYDGPYLVNVYTTNADHNVEFQQFVVYIQYNLTWKTKLIKTCSGMNTVEGWILRGNYTAPQNPVIVAITYPDNTLAASYFVAGNGSGQFSLTFPVTVPGDIGEYHVYVRDVYPDTEWPPYEDDMNAFDYTCYLYDESASSAGGWGENDAMIYDVLDNLPTNLAITASTYYSPVLLYKGVQDQTLLLSVVDQDGNYVSGLANYNGVDGSWWDYAYGDSSFDPVDTDDVDEISPGFYLFDVHAESKVDFRLKATATLFDQKVLSNTIVINLRDLTAFNPYIVVTTDGREAFDEQSSWDYTCDAARYQYAKLPCTIGDLIHVSVGYWEPKDPENYYVDPSSVEVTVSGPVREYLDGDDEPTGWYLVEKAGKIQASISMNVWRRVDQTSTVADDESCIDWFDGTGWTEGVFSGLWADGYNPEAGTYGKGRTLMSENACCESYTKTFDICEVKSCVLTSVTLEGDQKISATSIEVGKKADLVVNISGANAPAGLSCGCGTKIVRIYMVDGKCNVVPNAFSVDPWSGGAAQDVTELWYNGIPDSLLLTENISDIVYNPDHDLIEGRSSADAPEGRYYIGATGYGDQGTVGFAATTGNAVIIDNCEKLTFKGITFNYINEAGAPCDYTFVVEVFGLQRSFDPCGNMKVSYPFISETLDDIDILAAVKPLTTVPTVFEMGIDPVDILAGVPATIEITDPKFTVDTPPSHWLPVEWDYTFNGTASADLVGFPTMTASTLDSGYKFSFSCSFPKAGELVITGTSWLQDLTDGEEKLCTSKEVASFKLNVKLPNFDVKIELADGSIIANDSIITEGIIESIHVVPTDSRPDGTHDFTTDTTWSLSVSGVKNACALPTSKVCGTVPLGCTTPSPIDVYGLDNPNIEDTPQFRLYFTTTCGTRILINTFSLVKPTVTLTPTEVPFTIPASATRILFTVKDAHAHGAPGVSVAITGAQTPTAGASGYSFVAGNAVTDINGEADWAFVPPFSGQYKVGISTAAPDCFILPCGWSTFSARKTLTAKYQAPVVDTTKPVVTITAGIDGSKVTSATLNLTGKVTDNVGVTQLIVGFNKVDVLPDGSFMAALKLAAGENVITVVAYDAAGNSGTATAKVTYTAPVDTSITLVLTIGADIVSINGMATSIDAAPEIVASRTFVPMRFIAESFGATVEWLPETQGITITLGEHTVGLQIGNATAVVDGTIISLPAAPYIKNGRTMVPLRLISEAFGGDVVWDAGTRTITITYQP